MSSIFAEASLLFSLVKKHRISRHVHIVPALTPTVSRGRCRSDEGQLFVCASLEASRHSFAPETYQTHIPRHTQKILLPR